MSQTTEHLTRDVPGMNRGHACAGLTSQEVAPAVGVREKVAT